MNLLTLVQDITGVEFKQAGKKDGGEWSGACPFCKGGTDRFRVWPNSDNPTWWCRQCMMSGGSIMLMVQYYDISYHTAVERLKEMGYPLKETPQEEWKKKEQIQYPPPKLSDFDVDTDADQVEAWYIEGRAKAISYFGQWGLQADDIDRFWLGWGTYHGRSGFTIPHWWFENGKYYLKGVKFRHLTDDKKKRFSTVNGSNTRGIFNMKWVSNPNDTREGPLLNHLFILEAEKDAMLLDGMGYPAISFHPENSWLQHLYRSLKNVVVPIIVFDEDNGAGLNRALLVRDYIKSRPIITSTKKWNIKSPSDLAQKYGRDAVYDWVKSVSQDIEVYKD